MKITVFRTARLDRRTGRAVITEERLRQAVLVLLVLAGVLAYTTFQWGGVVRTGRYQSLLVLGLLAMLLSPGRSGEKWSPLPNRVLRWTATLLPAYVLLQVVPLPVAVLRVLSPARAEAMDALEPVGAKVSFASLSVFPAGTFQYFLLVCAYLVIFLLVRELTWHFRNRRWLVIWPILGIGAVEAGLGLWQYFGGTGEQVRWGTYANHNHYAGFLEMALPFAVMYPVAVLRRAHSRGHASVAPALAVSGLWALAALMFAGIIPVSYTHLDVYKRQGLKRALLTLTEKLACGCAHRVICVSHSLRQKTLQLALADAEKLVVLGSGSSAGVDINRFEKSRCV